MINRRDRGDTIVEVIIAFAVFSLVAVTALAIMNRGLAIAQNSLEVSLVRQQIDAQADILRFVRNSDDPDHQNLWRDIVASASSSTLLTTQDLLDNGCPDTQLQGSFALTLNSTGSIVRADSFAPANMYSGVMQNPAGAGTIAYGLWVNPAVAEGDSGAYDMHIRACWYSAGDDRPTTLATIVRLYET